MTVQTFKSHPWHGVPWGSKDETAINAYIEIVPSDTIKYEIDKQSGHLRVDRPQKYSNQCPTLYGFIPQTFCGERVGAVCEEATNRKGITGDGDPLDICVLSERQISHGDILLKAIPIGGIRMIDGNQADDKIIAVLQDDGVFGDWKNISKCPENLIERLRHYFLTYKDLPGEKRRRVEIDGVYDAKFASRVIRASIEDYRELIVGN